jgi:hypothetical protein
MNKDQVKALIEFVISSRKDEEMNIVEVCCLINEFFERNPQEPTVVGLTPEQADSFMTFWHDNESCNYIKVYKEWAKTQTFSNYNNEGKVYELDGSVTDYKGLYERAADSFVELEEEYSKLKAQLFEPNWDDAPEEAVIARIWVEYVNKHNVSLVYREILAQYERPTPPAPKVEVGQVWEDKKESDEIIIVALGKNRTYDTICYQFTESKVIEIRCFEDFLAKFEQVQP